MTEPILICPVCKRVCLKKWNHPRLPEIHYVHRYKDAYNLEFGYYQKAIGCVQWLYAKLTADPLKKPD